MAVTPITPTANLKILKGIPLDNSYNNTLSKKFFGSQSAQSAWFMAKAKYTFNDFGPIRMQNSIRVPVVADAVMDCNYIMFQNSNWSSKWFYAFITAVDWINVNMCQVHYEIDVMQTWLYDMNFGQSFIEREHANYDAIGANLVPEGLELGTYVSDGLEKTGLLNDWFFVVASIYDGAGQLVPGQMYAGMYSGVTYLQFDEFNEVNDYVTALTDQNKQDGIIAIYMCPARFYGIDLNVETVSFSKKYDNIDGYVPKNNKLFTYPYNFLYETNFQGSSAELRYEFFSGNTCDIQIAGDCTPSSTILATPKNYKGVPINYNENMQCKISIPCSYNTDYYNAWLAQYNTSQDLSFLGTTANAVGGMFGGGGFLGGVKSLVGETLSQLSAIDVAKSQPDHSKGSIASPTFFNLKLFDFGYMKMSITAEFATIIDNFFSMYGYATHEVKYPNIDGRQSWNYLKTQNCNVKGNICFDHLARIKEIVNSGITWWHGDWVGDYSRSNNIA